MPTKNKIQIRYYGFAIRYYGLVIRYNGFAIRSYGLVIRYNGFAMKISEKRTLKGVKLTPVRRASSSTK